MNNLDTASMHTAVPCPDCNTQNRVANPTISGVIACYSCSRRFMYISPRKPQPPKRLVAIFKRFRGTDPEKISTVW